jgi:hypothetical protein
MLLSDQSLPSFFNNMSGGISFNTKNSSLDNQSSVQSMKRLMSITLRRFSLGGGGDSMVVKKSNSDIAYESDKLTSIDEIEQSSVTMESETEYSKKNKKTVTFYDIVTVITVPNRYELVSMSQDLWYTSTEIQSFRKQTMNEIMSYAILHHISKKEAVIRLFKSIKDVTDSFYS